MVKTLDLAVRAVIRSTDIKIKYAATGTASAPTNTYDTDGTQSTAWTRDLQPFDVRDGVGYMEGTLFAPPYEDDNYVFVCSVNAHNVMFALTGNDFYDAAVRNMNGNKVWNGEVGQYFRARFVKESNSFAATTNGYKGEAALIGAEAWVEGVAVAPEIRAKLVEDYGRDYGLAWYAIYGVNEMWDTNTAGQAKVIHYRGTT